MKLDSTASVLLTGANGGIGGAIAREIARTGAKLLLSARRADAIAPLAKELGAKVLIADLTDRSQGGEIILLGHGQQIARDRAQHAPIGAGSLDFRYVKRNAKVVGNYCKTHKPDTVMNAMQKNWR